MDQILQVKIISPKQILFDGQAVAVSSINSNGKFDILPEHANFITLVENQPIIIRKADKTEEKFQFELAIIYNSTNSISIYTDIQASLNPALT